MPRVALLLLILLVVIIAIPLVNATEATWQTKVDKDVLTAAANGSTEFLLVLDEQAGLATIDSRADKAVKGAVVYSRLTTFAEQSQQPLLDQLAQLRVPYRSFWIANVIWVQGDAAVLEQMARSRLVERVVANKSFSADLPRPVSADMPATVEWNISKIGAPSVWDMGITGAGVVIGGQDTGYQWDHPALKASYRGWDGSTADHNYNWHDAITSGNGGVCGLDSPEPCDDYGHGTHTMGTMIGNDMDSAEPGWPNDAANAIGVAPGARWIGCRNMDVGNGTPTTYMDCFEWFIAPTDLNNTNPDPSKAPHVISNSWSCPESEGCLDPDILKQVVENTRAAGIVVVAAASNLGYLGCSSVSTPPSIYDATFTIGSVNSSDVIAGSSARGPVTVDGSGRLKPDVTAPGVNVRSAWTDDIYLIASGTSMASPHVAGLVALLIDADPELAGQVDALEALIRDTAVPLLTAEDCGGTAGEVPNNVYGFGRIDAFAAVQSQIGFLEPAIYLPTIQNP